MRIQIQAQTKYKDRRGDKEEEKKWDWKCELKWKLEGREKEKGKEKCSKKSKQNNQNEKHWNLITITHSFWNGTLTISGDGEMANYTNQNSTRWGINATLITKVIIKDPIISVGSSSFDYYYTKIELVQIANSVLKINQFAFSNCISLISLILSNNLILIDVAAFSTCTSLGSLILPNSLRQIKGHAFASCTSLTSLILPNNLTQIEEHAFNSCHALALLILPNNLSIISVYCFGYCSGLTSLTIPVGVTSLQEGAFYFCELLESVSISHTVTNIGDKVFQYCYALTCVYYDGTTDPGSSASNVFGDTKVDKVRVSTNYGSGNTFSSQEIEIGVSCIINKMKSKKFSPIIKSKLSSSFMMKMRRHWGLFFFQEIT